MKITEKALLVNLNISCWSAKKYDKKVSKEVEQQHGTYDAGRYNKNLISSKDHLETITKTASETRKYHYDNTLCWGDNGDRLLPIDNFFEYTQKINEYKQKFNDAVDKFIVHYPDLVDDARRRLNGMFDENDYPDIHTIKTKFAMKVETTPLPNTDFRVNINDEELEAIRKEVTDNINTRTDNAVKDVLSRIKEKVQRMYESLKDTDKVFRDTLVTNIRDLIAVVPKLNVTNDPFIDELCLEIKQLVTASPNNLRNDTRLRIEKSEQAKKIFDKVSDFI